MMSRSSNNGLPPGPSIPALATTMIWFTKPLPLLERCQARYGDMFTLRLAHEDPFVFLSDPDAIKQVFTGDPQRLHAGKANRVLAPVVRNHSVLLLDEAAHMEQRKLLLPPFHGSRMKGYGDLMDSIATAEVERWRPGERISLLPRMQAITLEIIVRAVFGVEDQARRDELGVHLRKLLDDTTSRAALPFLAVLGPERVTRFGVLKRRLRPIDEILHEEIRARRGASDLEQRDDILSLLLQATHEDGSPMRDEELRDELMTLLVAGHETTATMLGWVIERLVRHPAKLERLCTELAAGEDRYLDAVISETLRLRPVIPIVARWLTEPMEIGGRVLPAGVSVAPCIYLVHRRPDLYPEPERFLPERFLDNPPGTYTWIPFGGGVRRCLGASFAQFEMKSVLRAIFSRIRLQPVTDSAEPIRRRNITLVPGRGTKVKVAPA
jgi:cytochrome P450 family 135